uniref:Alpha-type protein kinase domain-containing protein n=1 Tax=Dicentrarchus labrax TaxID=13489 RepID=A0A8C4IFD1_DICLA
MDSQEVGGLLEECLQAAQQSTQPSEAERLNYCNMLCAELASLLQEAMDMKWPFVPEKWQYKQSVSASDKTNLNDLVSKNLSQLLAVLKASIVAQEARTALAVVFLVDRFLYWTDESSRLLKITKLLHRRHRDTPVAPQLVIRQARVYFNSGKLQKAEYILSSLINSSGATGYWVYHSESDRALVQAVSVQVRGMILQKLGLWLEAAELIWASLVGYYSLPQPDKKGIGTSLGILANILVSMNDEDFHAFSNNPDIDLSLLGDSGHRLLSAAQAAKMAVVYSQYTSLYVLTNVATQGISLLSYSFSVECPASQRQSFLLQAREAFTIGLLTKAEGQLVTSKQELHTFLKAAYSLTVTHKWLGTPQEVVAQATQACQKALANFYYYDSDTQDKDSLCAEIMNLVSQVKLLLRVEPFLNSDKGSFIPDSYRNIKDTSVNFTLEGFTKVMQRFQKYHASLCETGNINCKGTEDDIDTAMLCITALGTTIGTLNTECSTEACRVSKDAPKGDKPEQTGSNSSAFEVIQAATETLGTEEDWIPDISVPLKPSVAEGAVQSLSQLNFRTSSSSLSDSFSSQSSWEKISADLNSPTNRKPLANCLSEAGTSQSTSSIPRPLQSLNVGPKMDTEADTENSLATPHPNLSQFIPEQCVSTETSTESSFEMLEENQSGHQGSKVTSTEKVNVPQTKNPLCYSCLKHNPVAGVVPERQFMLSQQDYQALLSGVCHECALHLKFSKATGLWTARETCVYIGEPMGMQGKQRTAIWVQFLHQEERLSSYVGKDYLKPKEIQFHLKDVERQMTAQYYVTKFNKSLYDKEVMAQIFFIPSEALLILDGNEIVGCVTVEPYMLGDFVKLTNNTGKKDMSLQATEYGLAFGHFTYLFSDCHEVVVDLQGWVTANGKGLTYLTDPQIHSTKTPRGPSNFAARGLRYFLEEQHGPECNAICQLLKLPPVVGQTHAVPQKL